MITGRHFLCNVTFTFKSLEMHFLKFSSTLLAYKVHVALPHTEGRFCEALNPLIPGLQSIQPLFLTFHGYDFLTLVTTGKLYLIHKTIYMKFPEKTQKK